MTPRPPPPPVAKQRSGPKTAGAKVRHSPQFRIHLSRVVPRPPGIPKHVFLARFEPVVTQTALMCFLIQKADNRVPRAAKDKFR